MNLGSWSRDGHLRWSAAPRVGAGAEGPARTRQHQDPHVVVVAHVGQHVVDRFAQLAIERVQPFRSVEGGGEHARSAEFGLQRVAVLVVRHVGVVLRWKHSP